MLRHKSEDAGRDRYCNVDEIALKEIIIAHVSNDIVKAKKFSRRERCENGRKTYYRKT